MSIAFLALGLFVLGWAAREKYRAMSAASWPAVEGTMRRVAKGVPARADDTPLGTPTVRYVYDVDGKLYTGDRRCFGEQLEDDDQAASRYSEGTKVLVHYNPSDPAVSVLEARSARLVPAVGAGVTFLAIGGALYWMRASQSFVLDWRLERWLALPVIILVIALWFRGSRARVT